MRRKRKLQNEGFLLIFNCAKKDFKKGQKSKSKSEVKDAKTSDNFGQFSNFSYIKIFLLVFTPAMCLVAFCCLVLKLCDFLCLTFSSFSFNCQCGQVAAIPVIVVDNVATVINVNVVVVKWDVSKI